MRSAALAAVLAAVVPAPLALRAQQPAPPDPTEAANAQTSTLTVKSNLVVVPALVKDKSGKIVYTLQAKDFTLTDNGEPMKLKLEEDTGGEPLALVVLVETGADGRYHLKDYQNLATTLGAVVGNVPHKVAVISYDSTPRIEQKFSPDTDKTAATVADLPPGDRGAATLDALVYAVTLLRRQPIAYRRAILLLSETLDHGSKTPIDTVLRAIGDTNTMVYAVSFGSTRVDEKRESGDFSSSEPGPRHGCFANDPDADPDTKPSRAEQNYNCIAQLLPPLRFVRMAMIAIVNGFKRNVPETVANLTGGEYFKFHDVKGLDGDLITISNHVPNRYILSFAPSNPSPGFHTIELKLPEYSGLKVEARNGYWIDDDSQPK